MGDIHRFQIRYRCENDPGCPVFTAVVRAYDLPHAEERFLDAPDGEGWTILSIVRLPALTEAW